MLRRAERVHVSHKPGAFTNKGPVTLQIGSKAYITIAKIHRNDYQRMLDYSAHHPICFGRVDDRTYWLFRNRWHWDNDGLTSEQVNALLVTRDQRNQAQINRATTMVAMQQAPVPTVRGAIPEEMKHFIWTRDGGRCRQCGSNVELQFDHIIPIAYGGATTPENLQILCGPCNRRKGTSV